MTELRMEYPNVRFERHDQDDGTLRFVRCHLRRDDSDTIIMPEISSPERIFNGDIRAYSLPELKEITEFMESLSQHKES